MPKTVVSTSCVRSSPTSFPPRSRSDQKRWWNGTISGSPAPPSSGRIPTEKGYREFVDRLDDVKPMSAAERRAIQSFLESGVDLDDVLRRAVRLLAQLTRQVAVVQYPTLSTSTVRHLEVVGLTPARLLMVVITDTGRVDQRIVELGDVIDDHQLSQLREMLGQALVGKRLAGASRRGAGLAGGV